MLEARLREAYGRITFTHKTHEKAADLLLTRAAAIKWSQIVLAALTTGGLLAGVTKLLGDAPAVALSAAFASAALFGLNLYANTENLGVSAQRHRTTATSLWLIRERHLDLLTDIRSGDVLIDAIRARRDALTDDLARVYSGAPATWARAYEAARRALNVNEEMTFTDEELDNLLPPALRTSPPSEKTNH